MTVNTNHNLGSSDTTQSLKVCEKKKWEGHLRKWRTSSQTHKQMKVDIKKIQKKISRALQFLWEDSLYPNVSSDANITTETKSEILGPTYVP